MENLRTSDRRLAISRHYDGCNGFWYLRCVVAKYFKMPFKKQTKPLSCLLEYWWIGLRPNLLGTKAGRKTLHVQKVEFKH